jgi:hypothetical protein
MTGKMWQRPLKDGRVETYVSLDGHTLHLWAEPLTTQEVLSLFEKQVQVELPKTVVRKPALYGRTRAAAEQLTLEDMLR